MSFGGLTKKKPVIEIPRNTSSYTSTRTYYRRSFWERFSDRVADIGNWFAEHAENVLSIFCVITLIALVVAGVGYVISVWINEGFFMAILAAILTGVVGVIGWYVIAFVIVVGVNLVMYGFRFIFWNGWSLLLTLLVGLTIGGYVLINNSSTSDTHQQRVGTEVVQPATELYQCTASSLNVRTAPSTNSTVIGTLQKNQSIEVYEIKDGFARISYKGQRGYVSVRFLRKI